MLSIVGFGLFSVSFISTVAKLLTERQGKKVPGAQEILCP